MTQRYAVQHPLTPISVVTALDADALRREQSRIRQATLQTLRRRVQTLEGRRAAFERHCLQFMEQLERAPLDVFRYRRFCTVLSERCRRLDEQYEFLAGGGHGRIFVGEISHSRSGFARRVIARCDAEFLSQNPGASHRVLVEHACRLIANAMGSLQAKLRSIKSARTALTESARSVLRDASELERSGLLSSDQGAAVELQALLVCLFDELHQPRKPDLLRSVEGRIESLPPNVTVRSAFEAATAHVLAALSGELAEVLQREKARVLADGAHELVASLERWRRERVSAACSADSVVRAILALHYSFSTARQGIGGLAILRTASYEEVIRKAPPAEVLAAVKRLTNEGVMTADEWDVLRYNHPVWSAYQKSRGLSTRDPHK